MKLTKNLCREVKIFNPYEYAQGRIYIDYYTGDSGRMSRSPRWAVCLAGYNFGGHFLDYGNKIFTCSRDTKLAKLEEAKNFVRKFVTSPKLEFLKTPFGSYMDKEFVEQRNAQIIQMIKDKKHADSTM